MTQTDNLAGSVQNDLHDPAGSSTAIAADELRQALLLERYGPLFEVEGERPPVPAEVKRRRQVLLGEDEQENE